MAKAKFYCEATITSWNPTVQDYDEVVLEHWSSADTVDEAEYDAREVWNETGYNPDSINIKVC